LYHLLNGICINMPSLNQRQEDIPALAAIYINQYNAEFSREVIGLEPDAIAALQAFRWVLNIDQLRTVIRQLVLGANSYYITRSEVEAVLRDEKSTAGEPPLLDLNQPLEKIERDVILEVLKQENMNQSNAARRLEISRSTLWRKLGQGGTR
ncbi:MAG: helix-turn-helix domain-containing protein, partial [Aristaeellaceae bacterium]